MRFFFFAIAALLSVNTHAQQTLNRTITHGGISREYRLYIPAAYNGNTSVPLLFNLHGYTSNNVQQEFYGDFRSIADTANFIICLPNGTFDLSNNRFWNVGFAPSNVDDIGFISTLIDVISSEYNINAARVYSTGMSNGGYMSYSLACQLSERITAVASVTGSMTIVQQNNCTPSRAVPVMQIHGTNDPTVPYVGNATSLHIDTLVKRWANRNGCNATPNLTPVPDVVTTDGSTADRFDYDNCNDGAEVAFYKVYDATHTWPGAPINLGVTNMDFSASLEIWKFFSKFQHPSPLPTSVKKIIAEKNIRLYPNPALNTLNIEHHISEKISVVEIFDLQGKQILKAVNTANINISALSNGMYFCNIYAENGKVITERFVKN